MFVPPVKVAQRISSVNIDIAEPKVGYHWSQVGLGEMTEAFDFHGVVFN